MKKIKTRRVTDKMRLDWFDGNVYRSLGMIDARTAMVTDRTDDFKILNFRGRTVRQAIDAAIRREKKR